MGTWNAYGNEYWPADYLIDAQRPGPLRGVRRGRLRQDRNGDQGAAGRSGPPGRRQEPPHRRDRALAKCATPETYLGTARAQGWIDGPKTGTHDYGPPPSGALPLNDFAYSGTWNIAAQPADADRGRGHRRRVQGQERVPGAELPRRTPAARCTCCSTAARSRPRDAGADVHDGVVTVRRQRLYSLVSLPGDAAASPVAALRRRA